MSTTPGRTTPGRNVIAFLIANIANIANIAIIVGALSMFPGCALYCSSYATSGCLTVSEIRRKVPEERREELLALLVDERSWVREEAARALASFRDVEVTGRLEDVLLDGNERDYVRSAAAEALEFHEALNTPQVFLRILEDPASPVSVRIAVLRALCAHRLIDNEGRRAVEAHGRSDDLLLASAAKSALVRGCGGN